MAERLLERLPEKGKRQILLLAFILSGFLFIVLALVFSYHLSTEQRQFSPILGPLVNYHVEFMVAVAMLGIAVGAGVFYLLAGIVEKKKAETRWNASLLLRFLNDDEREVAALPGMGRVRAHRVVSKLLRRGVVSVRKAGKINILEMPQELLEGLKDG